MRRPAFTFFVVLFAMVVVAPAAAQSDAATAAEIVALERTALDHWMKGESASYEALLAADVTVFDPRLQTRVSGREAVLAFLKNIRPATPIPGHELIDPLVQRVDDAAVLTFLFVSYDADRKATSRWNFTEVYRRAGGRWQILHTHASFVGGTPPGLSQ